MWQPILRSMRFVRRHLVPAVMLVLIPEAIHYPMVVLKGQIPMLTDKYYPEVVLVVLAAGIVAATVLDCIVTCSTTVLFLARREESA